ncbi:MAG: M1 family metallopeptidase [Candidatus Neomarinimicrobiota bacterium]
MKKQFFLFFTLLLFLVEVNADNYPKNTGIDILHYRFELILSDDENLIKGSSTINILFKKKDIKEIRLDLINKNNRIDGKGMKVSGISLNDQSLEYIHRNNVLTISLDQPSKVDQEISITIDYYGIPYSGLKIAPNKHGDRTFFSDNWPNKARNWLPTVDHPYEKATSEMIVIAPNHYQIVSNGLLVEESNLQNDLKRTHWKQSVPISCWLYVLGVAEFAIQYVDTFEGKSIQTWVYKQDRDAGFYDFAVPTKQSLQFFSDYVGPFVYEKLANIQSNSVGGGMEAATAILYGDKSVTGKRETRWRNIIIHEVAHQWFGNAVTEYDWDDVWLSEGFATYFTLLFREHAYGREDFVSGLISSRDRVWKFYEKNKNYQIVHDNLSDMSQVTTSNTYQKGAWILHMLRNLVGKETFQKGIRNYYLRYLNSHASTEDFKHEMEKVSGVDLDNFFEQWLYNGGHIVLDGMWEYDSKRKEITINLEQVQNSGHLFSFPIEFGIYNEGEVLPSVMQRNVSQKKSSYSISAKLKPNRLVIDPRTVLLATWTLKEKIK